MPLTPAAIAPAHETALPPFLVDAAAIRSAGDQFAQFGFAVLGPAAIARAAITALRSEATGQRREASWPLRYGDGRSQVPEANMRGHFGPAARSFLASSAVARLMHGVTGQAVAPSWSASCYTWYDVPGAWLGRHCDKQDACFLTMLVGLESVWPASSEPGPGNQLWIYGSFTDKTPRYRVTTLVNRVTILDGKRWPHERQPVREGERVTVLCGCFRSAGS